MPRKYKVALLLNRDIAQKVIDEKSLYFLHTFAETVDLSELPEQMTEAHMKELIRNADACITCWGTPPLSEEILALAPDLKILGHAAGSVKPVVTKALWERGITVTSANPVMAQDVAETTLALILASLKRLWEARDITRSGHWQDKVQYSKLKRLHGLKVGVISASTCGRYVIELLKVFDTRISVYDPLLTEEEAHRLGVRKVDLPTLMAESDVVTVHAPQLPSTYHMINRKMLSLMKDNSLFINTSRGSVVDEEALIEELRTGRFFACLDVTDPEPPAPDSPLRSLDNVLLTPHIAGGHTVNGRFEMGRFVIEQLYKFLASNEPLDYTVTEEMLSYIA